MILTSRACAAIGWPRCRYQCPNADACVADDSGAIECTNHRTGPLCALCEDGWVMVGEECSECGNKALDWMVLVLAVTVLVCSVAFMVYRAMRSAKTKT